MIEEKILINELETNLKIAGSGQLILILHGWGGSSDSWLQVQKILAKEGFKVIIPDLPGFGRSVTPPVPWGIEDYKNFVNNFIKEAHSGFSEPFFLLGHSFGGRIAVKFTADFPEKIKGLILCDAAGIKPKRGPKTLFIFLIAKIGNAIFTPKHLTRFKDSARSFFYAFLRRKDYVKTKGTMRETIKKVLEEDLLPELEKIKTKTLIVWGSADKMVPLKYAGIFKEKIVNSQLEVFPGIGHSPHLEIPEKLAETIIKFLRGI